MLKVAHISNIVIHTDEWKIARLAKFTSSMIYCIMGDKMLTVEGVAYLYQRVGEEMTGIPSNFEVDTIDTRHGLIHEADAIRKFGEFMKLEFLVTQKLITAPGSRFGSTPDALWVKQKYGDEYDVETAEIKCYPNYTHFIRCVLCNTPQELKAVDKKLYWQVVSQMDICDCMNGNAVLYHPDFKAGGFKIIHFNKRQLAADFKLLAERKRMAITQFDEIRYKLLNLQIYSQ